MRKNTKITTPNMGDENPKNFILKKGDTQYGETKETKFDKRI